LEDSIDFTLHNVHGPLGHEAGSLGLLTAVLQALNYERLSVGDLKYNEDLLVQTKLFL
jgi:hypothetical protein